MLEGGEKSKASSHYNAYSGDFIPVACHYSSDTLLTKNGELVQTIKINGINSDKISQTLFNLRHMVRQAIKSNVKSANIAFWVHTIRRKANLDDPTPYKNYFPANIHDLWRRKNYWDDKFVNQLYITAVYSAPAMKIKDFNAAVNSLSKNTVANFVEKYHNVAHTELTQTVDNMLKSLAEYGAEKLSIRIDGDNCYSDQMFLYRRIMQLNEEDCLLPLTDISTALASHQYAVGTDMMEVIDDDDKKFAALISIKEYQEVSSDALDRFLQIPVEMIATEIFYFVDKSEVTPNFEYQNYIQNISKDKELREYNGLDAIFDETDIENKFCKQQISCMIIGNNIAELEEKIVKASNALANIGIVHVREDINLEKTFWAQLPGNFSYLSRMTPALLSNTAALASLHNFPTGNQYNPWGRALTLLRTERGTPYFANFHDSTNQAFVTILGAKASGRTSLMNFLLSESDKFDPTTLHITIKDDSEIYVEARGGKVVKAGEGFLNPFLLENTEKNRSLLFEFVKILAGHYINPMKDTELSLLKIFIERIMKLAPEQRMISSSIEAIKDSERGGKALRERLLRFSTGGVFYKLFEGNVAPEIYESQLLSIDLSSYNDQIFTDKHYPKEKKLVEQFEAELAALQGVKTAIAFLFAKLLENLSSNKPKILAFDDLSEITNLEIYSTMMQEIKNSYMQKGNIFFVSDLYENLKKYRSKNEWITKANTQFILPPEIKISELSEILPLGKEELNKLSQLVPAMHSFLIKQDGKTIAAELSIGGLVALSRILSSGTREKELKLKIISEVGNEPDKWVPLLYDELDDLAS